MRKVIYHKNCNDGSGAARAVYEKFGDNDTMYIPMQYGDALPEFNSSDDLILVDFSFKRPVVEEVAKQVNSMLIIDHHKTAQEDLAEPIEGVEIVFDMGKSGAVLAWEYFHPDTMTPSLLSYIQDRDLWKFDYDVTNEVAAGLMLRPGWRGWPLIGTDSMEFIDSLIQDGRAINEFVRMQGEKIIKSSPPIVWDITGDTVPVYNLPGFMVSDTLHDALEYYQLAKYAVSYFDMPNESKRVYSLRSRSGSSVDVSKIAVAHGGGGHKHAAGFSVSLEGNDE